MNIFIAHTPLQNYIAGTIASQYFPGDVYDNVLFSSIPNADTTHFREYHYLKGGRITKVLSVLAAKNRITRLLKKGNCQLFIPHTGALLDNYFFYSFPNARYRNRINFYYEGVLYFYEYNEPFNTKTHLFRKLTGLVFGMRYKRMEQIFPAWEDRVDTIYSILPEYTLGPPEKIRKIEIRQPAYAADRNKVLILGGKPSLLENSEVIGLYRLMLQTARELAEKPILLFKGHHADTSDNFLIANAEKLPYTDITQDKPVEEIVSQYCPGIILSYPSSGLINLKAMFGDEIDMVCYYTGQKRNQIRKLENLFQALGIRIRYD